MKLSKDIRFICDENEFSGVKKIADKVCLDIERITGGKPEIISNANKAAASDGLFFATLGKTPLAEMLFSEGELAKIRGKRECYLFAVKGEKITIVGSDKRGTIYGLFHLSELMGVSPLVDWNGILPAKRSFIELSEGLTVSKEPSVKFRGFFINDEWPAFGNFANHNFGGLNAKMYEHIFELLLRLKGNYLWPAMWASRFSDDGPGLANAELADELGVIMGASHHEPCCRAGEEYKHLRGPDSIYGDAWNFRSNEKGITKFWKDGLKRNGKFENVITVGMRGEADTAIMKNATLADNINLLRDVIKTQNRLIRENVNEDLTKVPRMLALYKEVEPYFYGDKHTKGLMDDPELDGVTLMLCEDNHGNLRTVPTEAMRAHKGGYGMYYHFDYHGWPYSFEWFNTSYLPKVKEQMTAAYEFGIRELWIVNMGDVLTNELPLSFFLDLAYDYESYSKNDFTTAEYTRRWVDFNFNYFNEEQKAEAADILINATKIANMRRTECIQPDTFHPENFGEGNRMLNAANDLIARTEALLKAVPKEQEAGFYSQLYLPVCGNMNVLRMQLYSGKNKFFAQRNALVANIYADKMKECYAYDKKIVEACDKVDGGRFYAMGWSEHFGFRNWCEANNQYPVYCYIEPTRKKRAVFWIDGQDSYTTGQDWTRRDLYLNAFKNPECTEACVKMACCNEGGLELKTSSECEWLSFTVENDLEKLSADGNSGINTVVIKIDRQKYAMASEKNGLIKIEGNDGHGARIAVNIHVDAALPYSNYPAGTFVQTDSYISMEAPHFVRSSGFAVLDGYGKTLGAVKAFPVTASYDAGDVNAPYVEYAFALSQDFVEKQGGIMAFDFYLNPSNPAYKDNKLQFIADVNGKRLLKDVVDEKFAVGDEQEPWGSDITNNIRISTVYADCKAGLNLLKVSPVTPNIVIEKIVIHDANTKMPESYLGAPETYRIK
ncbi:MAG: glycosyl hydrolase 115 family protein [Treponema sp.]|nr:glycosyl hydrolase 115 family protein [Treponema sp.]